MPISKLTSLPFPPPAVPPFSASGQGLVESVNQLIDTSVASLKSLPTSPQTGTVYGVIGFYASSAIGGGQFVWIPSANKSTHNGGTIIAPEALEAWSGTQANIAALLNWTGSGSGCWVRSELQGFVTPEMFGAVGDGVADDTDSIAAAHSSSAFSISYSGNKNYLIKKTNAINIKDGVIYAGNNCTITIPADAEITDTTGNFGRWANNVFYRESALAVSGNIIFKDFFIAMNARKINFIGGASISAIRDNSLGGFFLERLTFDGIGEAPGRGGPDGAFAECGALFYANGYILNLNDINVSDAGNAVIAFSSKLFFARNVRTQYCGVSRDHTTWVNAASLLARGSEVIDIASCYSYITGGTSYFISHDQPEPVKYVSVVNCTLIGCGLTAIGAGTRDYSPSAGVIDEIFISGVYVRGFTCAIQATLHSGIKVSLEDVIGSNLRYCSIDCVVDYLAPWETFNEVDGDVDGSFNINKTKGHDVGSQYSILSFPATGNSIDRLEIRGSVLNHQRGGIYVEKVDNLDIDVYAFNTGWSKDLMNDAYSTQNSAYVRECLKVNLKISVEKAAYLINENKAFCTPVYTRSNPDISLDVQVRDNGNQLYPIRVVNDVDNCNIYFKNIDFDTPVVSGGFLYLVDFSSGAFSKNTLIKSFITSQVLMTGSREVPEFTSVVKDNASFAGNKTATLLDAKMYDGKVIEFVSSSLWAITITPTAPSTIDGSSSPVVVPVNSSKRIISTGGNFFSV